VSFSSLLCDGQAGIGPFYCWSQAEQKMRDKHWYYCLPLEVILLRHGQGVGLILLQGGRRVESSQLLKGQTFSKVLAVIILVLRYALMTLAIPTFLARMSL
jgi:hypothetical protein